MVKITGAEWKRFYTDDEAWPDGAWHDGEEITIDGLASDDVDLSDVPDSAIIKLYGGVMYMNDTEDGPSLEAYFKRWRKRQSTTVLIVEVANELADAVRDAIVAAGGKVRK
jgi:hypothetical protein